MRDGIYRDLIARWYGYLINLRTAVFGPEMNLAFCKIFSASASLRNVHCQDRQPSSMAQGDPTVRLRRVGGMPGYLLHPAYRYG